MITICRFLLCAGLFVYAGFTTTAFAQDASSPAPQSPVSPALPTAEQSAGSISMPGEEMLAPEALILNQIERELKDKYKKEIYIPPSIQSLIYTTDQQALLREARAGFNTQVPTEEENKSGDDPTKASAELTTQKSAIRAISLGGIIFSNPKDWTIWLNKKLVTVATIPTQAVDLRVYKDFIELRWFDSRTNKIFPIRLRPNQTFNLDAQTFIPG